MFVRQRQNDICLYLYGVRIPVVFRSGQSVLAAGQLPEVNDRSDGNIELRIRLMVQIVQQSGKLWSQRNRGRCSFAVGFV